jgi:hypothetical protein
VVKAKRSQAEREARDARIEANQKRLLELIEKAQAEIERKKRESDAA